MVFDGLLQLAGNLPCFSARFLAAGENLAQVRLQLARWVRSGRIIKLHKGLYTLAAPYRKIQPDSFHISNALKAPSYVSLQSALSWHGLIPEFVPAVTAVTTTRPQILPTPLGRFEYRHISSDMFWGFQRVELPARQEAFVADPEKAILDLVYLTPGGERPEFLRELRLQNLGAIRREVLHQYAENSGRPKLKRAVANLQPILDEGEGVEL
jgi:predicted transcriptional regulator of viral defense system